MYTVVQDCKHSSTGYQNQMIWRHLLSSSLCDWGSDEYIGSFLSDTWKLSKAESENQDGVHSLFPWERLCTTRCMPNLKTAPQAEAPEQRKRPPSQTGKVVCLSLLSLLCPWGCSLPRTVSPIATVPWDPKMQGLATR